MQQDLFISALEKSTEYSSVLKNIQENKTPMLVNGLLTVQRAHQAFFVNRKTGRKIVVFTSNEIEASRLYHDLDYYTNGQALFLQNDETKFYSIDAQDRQKETERIKTLIRLSMEDYEILVMSVETAMRKYIPKEIYQKSVFDIRLSDSFDINELFSKLISYGYEREARVESAGQISLRGGIIDIFPVTEKLPYRIEFFGDDIDSIRKFNPDDQKSLEKSEGFTVTPAREIVLDMDTKKAAESIRRDAKSISDSEILYDAEKIEQGHYFEGMHKYIDYLYENRHVDIFSYFKKDSIIMLNEPNRILEKGENYYEEFSENFKSALEKGNALKKQGHLYYTMNYVADSIADNFIILNSYLPKSIQGFNTASIVNFDTREPVGFLGRISSLADEVVYLKKHGHTVLIVEKDEASLKNLKALLLEAGITASEAGEGNAPTPQGVYLLQGNLSEGYIYSSSALAVITDKEIFGSAGKSKKKSKPKYKGKKIDSFVDMNVGDYVVHETYGVGRFEGIESKVFDDIRKDYIRVVYNGGDALYVPLSQMDKVQKYIGSAGDSMKLSKLGTTEWKKTKAKAKKAVDEIAHDLIELYAQRRDARGYSFSPDTPWQREFEALFPYEETTDQENAIIDVKSDMQSIRPMDRLICGDVGYGKTEVAIRAIFKACMESKQVAFLVPTTILAQQHYNTLTERFQNYPIRVEVASRFKTKKEQEKIVEDARTGIVDIIIGTHRLLSKDVKFKNLGLVVIDEEQRFGVKHKELLKQLKQDVDVITLSATPIPRTLHLSLSGIRDMSLLEEPPEDRHPIMTYVTEAKEGIILDAIERELSRGGQVFFVYNRVQTIDKMADMIRRLVPDASLAVAHGQMSPRKLENIMVGFLEKEYDILLSTTIIETGMDISNANTMIVYDADKMGLSQLYQLRGRVGRSSRQAYAYFMYEKDKVLTEISEKRLKAIKEFTEFGSGFKIAMRDLEIRGAGNILGERQHGHMAEIGYDLYVKLLDQAIRDLQGQTKIEEPDTEIDLEVNAFIPDSYIEDEMSKIEIYKKIAAIENQQDMFDIEEEIEDRYSDIPLPVRNLLYIAYIKSLGKKLGIVKIKQINSTVSFMAANPKDTVKKSFKEPDDYKLVTNIARYLELMI